MRHIKEEWEKVNVYPIYSFSNDKVVWVGDLMQSQKLQAGFGEVECKFVVFTSKESGRIRIVLKFSFIFSLADLLFKYDFQV